MPHAPHRTKKNGYLDFALKESGHTKVTTCLSLDEQVEIQHDGGPPKDGPPSPLISTC